MSLILLPHIGMIRAHGADAGSFLQAQLSNDAKVLSLERAQLSGYCSAKGRLLAVLTVVMLAADDYALLLPASLVAVTLKRLRMFVLRSKLVLEDGGADWGISGCLDGAGLIGLGLAVPQAPWGVTSNDACVALARPGECSRFFVLHRSLALSPDLSPANAGERDAVSGFTAGLPSPTESGRGRLAGLGTDIESVPSSQTRGEGAFRLAELEAGLPIVHPETLDHFVPQTADLDLAGGISFTKGCYPGQEIVARVHYLGRLKQRLFLAQASATAPPGASVFDAVSGQAVGEVMDSAATADGYCLGLVLNLSQAANASLRLGAADGVPLSALRPAHPAAQAA